MATFRNRVAYRRMSALPVATTYGRGDPSSEQADGPEERVVMFASPVNQLCESLETIAHRLRSHNELVTRVVLAHRSDCGGDLNETFDYTRDGTLVTVPISCADDIAIISAHIMEALAGLSAAAGNGSGVLQSRIGLSAGVLEPIRYHSELPRHRYGESIEIAARLVTDIAAPGDVIVDDAASSKIDIKAVRERISDFDLLPRTGEMLPIDGIPAELPIFELIWTGTRDADENRRLHNRRRLAHELLELKMLAFDLRLKLSDDLPHDLGDRNLGNGEVKIISSAISQLDPKHSTVGLEQQWQRSPEARKNTQLEKRMDAILVRYKSLNVSWFKHRQIIRKNDRKGSDAARACVEQWEVFTETVDNFLEALDACLQDIEGTL